MWRVLLRGNPSTKEEVIEVAKVPAVVRHNERRLESGYRVVDLYVVNVADPLTHRAVADFMEVDVLEGPSYAVIDRTPYGVKIAGHGDEPAG